MCSIYQCCPCLLTGSLHVYIRSSLPSWKTPEVTQVYKSDAAYVSPDGAKQWFDAVEPNVSAWWRSCHLFLSSLFPTDWSIPPCFVLPLNVPLLSNSVSIIALLLMCACVCEPGASWVLWMTRGQMQCHFSQGLSSVSPSWKCIHP